MVYFTRFLITSIIPFVYTIKKVLVKKKNRKINDVSNYVTQTRQKPLAIMYALKLFTLAIMQ